MVEQVIPDAGKLVELGNDLRDMFVERWGLDLHLLHMPPFIGVILRLYGGQMAFLPAHPPIPLRARGRYEVHSVHESSCDCRSRGRGR